MEKRLTEIEICLTDYGRMIDDLSQEMLRLSKQVSYLKKQIENLKAERSEAFVKPLSEEVPPPHY